MYFDNYPKNNANISAAKYDNMHVSNISPHPKHNLQHTPPSNKPFFNPRYADYPQNNIHPGNKNFQQSMYQPKTMPSLYSHQVGNKNMTPQQMQSKNNDTSLTQEGVYATYNRQAHDHLRRRDSISFNSIQKPPQTHSPSHNNILVQNSTKPYLRSYFGNEHSRNIQQGAKPPIYNNLSNTNLNVGNSKTIQQNIPFQESNKLLKDLSQQKFLQKIGLNKFNYPPTNNNQNIANKVNSYQTAINTNVDQNSSVYQNSNRNTSMKLQDNDRNFDNSNIDCIYKFDLKFGNSELNSFNSTKHPPQTNEFKYHTPLNVKQKSNKQENSFQFPKNEFSRISQAKASNFNDRQIIFTDRQIYKSPSYDNLFHSTISKQIQKNKNVLNHTQNLRQNQNYEGKSSENQQKYVSQALINEDPQKKARAGKNYHVLIQDLQKKFSEHKKSTDSFQIKERKYIVQLSKNQQKIKQLQNILQNNKETISSMDCTIRQLNKKSQVLKFSKYQLSTTADSANLKDLEIQQLKKENARLKEQAKKQRKKSVAFTESNTQRELKQKIERLEARLKDIQGCLSQMNKQKESYINQISKLRQSNSNLHQEYNNQIKQHQKMREQLVNLKKTKDHVDTASKYNKSMYSQIHSKYEKALIELKHVRQQHEQTIVKMSAQNLTMSHQYQAKAQKQRQTLYQTVQNQKRQKQQAQQQLQKLKIKNQRLEAEINFKSMKLKTLQQKFTQIQSEIQSKQSAQKIKGQMSQIYMEELQIVRQKLNKKEQTNQKLAEQLNTKTKMFERMIIQKGELENKLEKLQGKVKSLKLLQSDTEILQCQTAKRSQKTPENIYFQSRQEQITKKDVLQLLNLYHQKYREIAALFNLNENEKVGNDQKQSLSLTCMPHEDIQEAQINENTSIQALSEYISCMHPLIKDQILKIHKDLKKLLGVLKQNQTQSQQKGLKMYELDKTLKKQGARINGLMNEIHMKNSAILAINRMQIQKQVARLNQKYEILSDMGLNSAEL